MPAEMVSIAEAVKEELANGDWSFPFTLFRQYLPEHDSRGFLEGEVQVNVLKRSVTVTAEARDRDRFDYVIAVVVDRKLNENADDPTVPSIEDQGDEFMAFVEEIADHFRRRARPLASYQAAVYAGMVNEPIYDDAKLQEERFFTGALLFTFRTWRDK